MSVNLPESSRKILLRILSLIMLMEMLDATVLNTALPQIALSLHVNPIELKEVLTVYFLSLGIFIPVSGWVADRFGEKNGMLFAIALFTLSSIGCGLSFNLPMLVTCRFFQGVGGAFLMPLGRQIMVRVFKGIGRVQAMAKVNIMTLMGVSLGPLIGGAITTYANWRWIFFINIPVGILAYYLISNYLPVIREREKIKFDLSGFILIGVFLGTLLYLLDILIDYRVAFGSKVALLIISASSLIIYILYAQRTSTPIISLNLFRQGEFKYFAIGSFFARLTVSTQPFLVPLLLQTGYGLSAMKSGLLTVPVLLSTLFCMFFIAKIAKKFDYSKLLIVNTFLLIIVFCSYYWQAVHLNLPLLLIQQLIMGFLMPLQYSTMNSQAYETLTDRYVSQGTSVYSGIIQVSGSFGIALAAMVMIAVIGPSDLQHHVPLVAFQTVFIVQSIYMVIALVLFANPARRHSLFPNTKT